MKELRWEIGWLGCRPIKVLHFRIKINPLMKSVVHHSFFCTKGTEHWRKKWVRKNLKMMVQHPDVHRSSCHSQMLTTITVMMYAYQKLTIHQRSHHPRSVVLRTQQPMLNYKRQHMINFPNLIWLIYCLGIPELDRLGWKTGKRVFPIHRAKMMKTRFLSRSRQRYRLSSLQGECLLLLDSTKDSESATVLRLNWMECHTL